MPTMAELLNSDEGGTQSGPVEPVSKLRGYTDEEHNWIRDEIHRYGRAHSLDRISFPELTQRFNAHWTVKEDHSLLRIRSYTTRHLRDILDQYKPTYHFARGIKLTHMKWLREECAGYAADN